MSLNAQGPPCPSCEYRTHLAGKDDGQTVCRCTTTRCEEGWMYLSPDNHDRV